MNIIEAARAMGQGKTIKRMVWIGRYDLYFVPEGKSVIMDWYGDVAAFKPEDLAADDWEVVDEQNV